MTQHSAIVCRAWLGGVPWFTTMSSHLVTQLHHSALICFDLHQMKGNVSVELLEEGYAVANQDRQDRITNLVGQPETKAFAGNQTASNKPDGTKLGPQVPIHKLREVA